MRILGRKVIFRTDNRLFGVEKCGEKPYTVRIMNYLEFRALVNAPIDTVRIEHAQIPKDDYFECKFLSTFLLAEMLGKVLVGIAWIREEKKEIPGQ